MPPKPPQPTDFKFEGIDANEFIDKNFLRILKQKFPDININIILFRTTQEDDEGKITSKERMSLGFHSIEDMKKGLLMAGAEEPETAKLLIDAIIEFYKEKECEEVKERK